MKNTIEINGKTYRCRTKKFIPLKIYLGCNIGKEYLHSLRFINHNGIMTMRTLNRAFRGLDGNDSDYDLIEVKSKTDQLIDLLKSGKAKDGVLSRVWDYRSGNVSAMIVKGYRESADYRFHTHETVWRYAEPLTDEEIDKMRFSRLVEDKQ